MLKKIMIAASLLTGFFLNGSFLSNLSGHHKHKKQASQSTVSQQTVKKKSKDSNFLNELSGKNAAKQNALFQGVFNNPNYQQALEVLTDEELQNAYADGIASIQEGFFDHFLSKIQPYNASVNKKTTSSKKNNSSSFLSNLQG